MTINLLGPRSIVAGTSKAVRTTAWRCDRHRTKRMRAGEEHVRARVVYNGHERIIRRRLRVVTVGVALRNAAEAEP